MSSVCLDIYDTCKLEATFNWKNVSTGLSALPHHSSLLLQNLHWNWKPELKIPNSTGFIRNETVTPCNSCKLLPCGSFRHLTVFQPRHCSLMPFHLNTVPVQFVFSWHLTTMKTRHGTHRIKTKNTFSVASHAFTIHSTAIFTHSKPRMHRNCTGS